MKSSSPPIDRPIPDGPVPDDIAIAILAAGSGVRFGGGKLDAQLSGRPVGQWVTDTAERAGFARRILVTPPTAPGFVEELEGWERASNQFAADGLASSIRVAARHARGCQRLVLVLGDMPLIEEAHLRALAFASGIVFTLYPDARPGVPAALPARCLDRLSQLSDGAGAASLEWGEPMTRLAPGSNLSLRDVDKAEDIELLALELEKLRTS